MGRSDRQHSRVGVLRAAVRHQTGNRQHRVAGAAAAPPSGSGRGLPAEKPASCEPGRAGNLRGVDRRSDRRSPASACPGAAMAGAGASATPGPPEPQARRPGLAFLSGGAQSAAGYAACRAGGRGHRHHRRRRQHRQCRPAMRGTGGGMNGRAGPWAPAGSWPDCASSGGVQQARRIRQRAQPVAAQVSAVV